MIASLLGLGLVLTPAAMLPTVRRSRADAGAGQEQVEIAQLGIRSRIVIRVRSETVTVPVEVIEKKGPRCVPLAGIAGAAVQSASGVDFILRGGQRVRARFSSGCPALDFYSGFYIVPNADGQVCADRDMVRSRAGGECPIDRFRTLIVRPPGK